jgi:hypothetical protein
VIKKLYFIFLLALSFSRAEVPPSQLLVSYMQGNGIGYQGGYSSAAAFLTSEMWGDFYFFMDVRAHVLNDGKGAYNLGVGSRSISRNQKAFLGANLFFDYRHTSSSFQRMSLGLDSALGPFFFSTNGYLLVAGKANIHTEERYVYQNGYIYSGVIEEESFKCGWDGEMGLYPINQPEFRAYLGGGPYYLKNTNLMALQENIWGAKGRIFIEIKKICKLEFIYSKDGFFGRKSQGQITFTFPFSKKGRTGNYAPVVRQEIIPVTEVDYFFWNW